MQGSWHTVPLLGVTHDRVRTAIEFFSGFEQRRRIKERLAQAHTPEARRREVSLQNVARSVSPGRPVGSVAGSWVTDCAELRQCVMLCGFCDHKFRPSHQKYGYVRDVKWPNGVGGNCDGCRVFQDSGIQLYVHEQFVGQSYTPR